MQEEKQKIVLAFSGGLDTSFCVLYLKEEYNADIITVTVDTGGFSPQELEDIERRSQELGAFRHYTIDGRRKVYDEFVTYIIKGNILRGGTYPLCVGAERVVQAEEVVNVARGEGAEAIAHGSTSGGNDQIRFDVALSVLAPEMKIFAPIRKLGITRDKETAFLEQRGIPVSKERKVYSINEGLWGTTIGGGVIHDAWQSPPEEVYTKTISPSKASDEPEELKIGFDKGVPISLNGEKLEGVPLIARLNEIAAKHGVGRGIHLGDTILGIKGRIAFEAGAPLILITAHRELEKLVLTRWQRFWKSQLSEFFGNFLHEGLYFDPVMKDIKALIDSSQERVVGEVRVQLYKGNINVLGYRSRHSLMNRDIATYGEESILWDGRDAEGFCKIYGLQSILARRAEDFADQGE